MVLLDLERFIISRQWLRLEAFFFVVPDGGVLPNNHRVSVAIASFHAMTSASTRSKHPCARFQSVCCVVFAERPELVVLWWY